MELATPRRRAPHDQHSEALTEGAFITVGTGRRKGEWAATFFGNSRLRGAKCAPWMGHPLGRSCGIGYRFSPAVRRLPCVTAYVAPDLSDGWRSWSYVARLSAHFRRPLRAGGGSDRAIAEAAGSCHTGHGAALHEARSRSLLYGGRCESGGEPHGRAEPGGGRSAGGRTGYSETGLSESECQQKCQQFTWPTAIMRGGGLRKSK